MLRELKNVLTALLFYDFLLSFMLIGCDGYIESVIVSLYCAGEGKAIKRYRLKSREKIDDITCPRADMNIIFQCLTRYELNTRRYNSYPQAGVLYSVYYITY